MGQNFIVDDDKSHLTTSGKACSNQEYESLRNSRPYWNFVQYGDSSEESWT